MRREPLLAILVAALLAFPGVMAADQCPECDPDDAAGEARLGPWAGLRLRMTLLLDRLGDLLGLGVALQANGDASVDGGEAADAPADLAALCGTVDAGGHALGLDGLRLRGTRGSTWSAMVSPVPGATDADACPRVDAP